MTLASELALILSFFMAHTHTANSFQDTANYEPFSTSAGMQLTAGIIKLILIETVESSSRLLAAPGPVPLRYKRLE